MAQTMNNTITVTYDTNANTFTFAGPDIDAAGNLQPEAGENNVYSFELATIPPDAPVQTMPLTLVSDTSWVWVDGWNLTVQGFDVQPQAGAKYRLSVVYLGVTQVQDPTIIMAEPPGQIVPPPLVMAAADLAAPAMY